MCSTGDNCVLKQEFDDSGCVQDDSMHNGAGQVSLLNFSDDVLLYILRHCTPRDLKALGYSCARLGRLVRERSLWRHVDARAESCSRARLKWFLDNALHSDTRALMLSGYARDADGCIGLINVSRKEAEQERKYHEQRNEPPHNRQTTICEATCEIPMPLNMDRMERHRARFFISAQRTQLPRHRCFASWPDDGETGRPGPQSCSGPQFTLTQALLQQLSTKCPQLSTLVLEYCNIDCSSTYLGTFPKTLKRLSLRGTKCYNMTFDKSFLFKIQDYLPVLESLDVSECEWMDPATLLPLSKMQALEELVMQDCYKLAEFVAYASLTARYGFRVLKSLDLRGSPVGDSEVSALGWLPQLEKLWLSARRTKRSRPHAHYADDERSEHKQLDLWETNEPDYFKSKSNPESSFEDVENLADSLTSPDATDEGTGSFHERYGPLKDLGTHEDDDKRGTKRKPEDEGGDSAELDGEPSCKCRKTVEKKSENDNPSGSTDPAVGTPNRNVRCEFEFNEDYDEVNGNKDAVNEVKSKDVNNEEPNIHSNDVVDDLQNRQPINDSEILNEGDNEVCCNADNGNRQTVNIENDSASNIIDNNDNCENGNQGYDNIHNNRGEVDAPEEDREKRFIEINTGDDSDGRCATPDCIVDCIKIDQLIDVSDARCGRQNEVIVIASSSRTKHRPSTSQPSPNNKPQGYVHFRQNSEPVYVNLDNDDEPNGNDQEVNEEVKNNDGMKPDDGDNKDEEKPGPSDASVNEGASTSKDDPKTDEQKEKYVLFRKNRDPIYVNCSPEQVQRRDPLPPVQYQIEPRHHVLYVGVGPQLNTYRFPRDSSELLRHLNFRPSHVDSSSLVTDFAIRRFGRADGEDVNIIHIGPNGPMLVGQATGSRPDRSSLRFLSVTGYRNITDRSLMHLATAAPNLTHVNFSGTSVTGNGAENFKSLRPDCEVIFSPFDKDEK